MMRRVRMVVVPVLLTGCSTVVGADFDDAKLKVDAAGAGGSAAGGSGAAAAGGGSTAGAGATAGGSSGGGAAGAGASGSGAGTAQGGSGGTQAGSGGGSNAGAAGAGSTGGGGSSAGTAGAGGPPTGGTAGSAAGGAAGTSAGSAGAPTGLDPGLVVPPEGNQPCTDYTALPSGCPTGMYCRIATATGGRCDAFVNATNTGKPCTSNAECSYRDQCFTGKCFKICLKVGVADAACGGNLCASVGNPSAGLCQF